jgi:NADPH:quinone reductase-like Zn-dependent oxidoreductase
MKAYELHPNEGFASVQPVERPDPPAPGPSDVRVRMRAASLNFRDLAMARGAKARKTPIIPLSDGAGEVEAVGSAVKRFKVGDRVAAAFFPTWLRGELLEEHHSNALGGSLEGVLAEHVVLPETAWVRLPDSYSFEQGATLPCAGVTAWHALFEAASLKPSDHVLVQGSGGVSIFALQLARAAGAQVIATSSSADKRARLEKMGAKTTIDYRENPNWGELARAATGGRGIDVAVEVGGAGTFDQTVKSLRFGGTMSLIGVLTGVQGPVNTHQVLHKALRVHGVYVGSVEMFEGFVRALVAHEIEPIIDRVFRFSETKAAYEYLASGAHFGKVVIRID